jgi:hypothetical protein
MVQLRSGGTLTLTVSVDVFAMESLDREFVFGLIDKMREYEQKYHPSQKPVLTSA